MDNVVLVYMKHVLILMSVFIVALCLAWGCWRLERWWNWKVSYQSQVEQVVQPLEQRVTDLEKRVLVLENKK